MIYNNLPYLKLIARTGFIIHVLENSETLKYLKKEFWFQSTRLISSEKDV